MFDLGGGVFGLGVRGVLGVLLGGLLLRILGDRERTLS